MFYSRNGLGEHAGILLLIQQQLEVASTGFNDLARHLIIVATSPPGEMPNHSLDLGDTHSEWRILAQRLERVRTIQSSLNCLVTSVLNHIQKMDVQCHMILDARQNMQVFTQFFHDMVSPSLL